MPAQNASFPQETDGALKVLLKFHLESKTLRGPHFPASGLASGRSLLCDKHQAESPQGSPSFRIQWHQHGRKSSGQSASHNPSPASLMLPTQGAAHTLITQQTKGTSQFLAWHRGVERQPPWQKPSLHGTQEEQLEAVHLCSAVHPQESDSGETNPADEPLGM